jgi:hypothetical protein
MALDFGFCSRHGKALRARHERVTGGRRGAVKVNPSLMAAGPVRELVSGNAARVLGWRMSRFVP